jgi:hypothetical protein
MLSVAGKDAYLSFTYKTILEVVSWKGNFMVPPSGLLLSQYFGLKVYYGCWSSSHHTKILFSRKRKTRKCPPWLLFKGDFL